MATKSDAPVVDKDKDVLMEVRGIIDGCLDSGGKEYKKALQDVAVIVNEFYFPLKEVRDKSGVYYLRKQD